MLIPRVETFYVIFSLAVNLATTFRASGEAVHGDFVILIETDTHPKLLLSAAKRKSRSVYVTSGTRLPIHVSKGSSNSASYYDCKIAICLKDSISLMCLAPVIKQRGRLHHVLSVNSVAVFLMFCQ